MAPVKPLQNRGEFHTNKMEIAGFWNKITLEIGGKYEYKVICTSTCPDLLVEEEEEEKSLK